MFNNALWKKANTEQPYCTSHVWNKHKSQLLFFFCNFTVEEIGQNNTLVFCTFLHIDGKLTAFFCCTNLGAGMKCQLCDTNISHCAPACRSRIRPADSDLIKMHWGEQLSCMISKQNGKIRAQRWNKKNGWKMNVLWDIKPWVSMELKALAMLYIYF